MLDDEADVDLTNHNLHQTSMNENHPKIILKL
jgi:hypothetical protein